MQDNPSNNFTVSFTTPFLCYVTHILRGAKRWRQSPRASFWQSSGKLYSAQPSGATLMARIASVVGCGRRCVARRTAYHARIDSPLAQSLRLLSTFATLVIGYSAAPALPFSPSLSIAKAARMQSLRLPIIMIVSMIFLR